MSAFTHINLRDVDDAAVTFGLSEIQEARFAGGALEAEATGVAHQVIKPGRRQAFGHRHAGRGGLRRAQRERSHEARRPGRRARSA